MQIRLKISILLNCSLAAGLIWAFVRGSEPAPSAVPAPNKNEIASIATTPGAAANPARVEEVLPFRWSQLESTDYRTYIKNLRTVGCPEQTIRDIITADVDGLYRERRGELDQKLAAAANDAGSGPRTAWEAELRRLPDEESTVLVELLGLRQTPVPVAADTASTSAASPGQPPMEKPVSMPLVFANVDPATLNLDQSRLQAISSLQRKFMEELGGPGQDPNDPAYRERWQKAQPEIDRLLRGYIGINAYQQYDRAARRIRAAGAQ